MGGEENQATYKNAASSMLHRSWPAKNQLLCCQAHPYHYGRSRTSVLRRSEADSWLIQHRNLIQEIIFQVGSSSLGCFSHMPRVRKATVLGSSATVPVRSSRYLYLVRSLSSGLYVPLRRGCRLYRRSVTTWYKCSCRAAH